DADSKYFQKDIWKYNSALSFTCFKYSPDQRAACLGPRIQCFQIHGKLYHVQGSLNPLPDHQLQFAQLFLYDFHFANNMRQRNNINIVAEILHALTNILYNINCFINLSKIA
ncbi:hypothetical protein L873DRAFT_1621615, partial [Choiromyces venosus 120613-1]